jgi:hypothetical protein
MILEFRLTPPGDAVLEGLRNVGELAVAQGLPTVEELAVIAGLRIIGELAVIEGLRITGELAEARGLPMVKEMGDIERLCKSAVIQGLPILDEAEVRVVQGPLVIEDLPVVKRRSYLKAGRSGFSGGKPLHAPVPSQLGLTGGMMGEG